jgi:NAD(P)-dependent dehydrogenase (short-subunit alcohol dehydrogenase family)
MSRRVALVTGASRNIGRAIALKLAESGHAIACFGRDRETLDETATLVRGAGGNASVFVGDARSNTSVEQFAAYAIRTHGGIDVVVNNAGAVREMKPSEITPEEFADDLQINLVSQFALARAAYPALKVRGQGVIINIGSIAGAVAFPRTVSYCASKAAIEGMTRSLALDWARDNIRVLCVAPGYVEAGVASRATADASTREWVIKRIPQRRLAKPEEIGSFVAFMASDAASFCTGETYYVDGGQRMAI